MKKDQIKKINEQRTREKYEWLIALLIVVVALAILCTAFWWIVVR